MDRNHTDDRQDRHNLTCQDMWVGQHSQFLQCLSLGSNSTDCLCGQGNKRITLGCSEDVDSNDDRSLLKMNILMISIWNCQTPDTAVHLCPLSHHSDCLGDCLQDLEGGHRQLPGVLSSKLLRKGNLCQLCISWILVQWGQYQYVSMIDKERQFTSRWPPRGGGKNKKHHSSQKFSSVL